jgi:hypothetical protein
MKKRSKLMIYVRADFASDAIRWAIRLSQTTPTFCSFCVGRCLENMERGLNVWRDVAPRQWDFVNVWKLRQGKSIKTVLGPSTIQRALSLQQGYYRQAEPKLKEFERVFQAGKANLRVVFQVHEGPEGSERAERWPEKLRRMARYFCVKPNELANRMIAAGIHALEHEDPDYEPDFVIEYRQKVVIPKIEHYQSEKKLAEAFDPYSDVPKELESNGWAFMGLIEVTNLHNRELVHGLLEGRTVQETFSDISRDTTLSPAYLNKLKEIYSDPIYQDSIEAHPLREKKLKKEIVDAWVEEWRRTNRPKPSESSVIADITALLLGLSEDGLRRVRSEVNVALLTCKRKIARKPCASVATPAKFAPP